MTEKETQEASRVDSHSDPSNTSTASGNDVASATDIVQRLRSSLFKSRLLRTFYQNNFWDASRVDLVWRHNGRDVREEGDWLKDLWYLVRSPETTGALHLDAPVALADRVAPSGGGSGQFYHVEVHDDKGMVVSIEPRMLSGRDIGASEESTIRAAIETLCGFIGLSPAAGEAAVDGNSSVSVSESIGTSPERETQALSKIGPHEERWQDISTAPPGELVLYFPEVTKRNQPAMMRIDVYPVSYPRKPTHWMPLPAPPSDPR